MEEFGMQQCALKAARHNSLGTRSYLQLPTGSPREVSLPALSLDHPLPCFIFNRSLGALRANFWPFGPA